MLKHGKILGIRLNSTPRDQVLKVVRERTKEREKFSIFTPNPEIIVKACKNKRYQTILNSGDILLSDGVGLAAAAKFLDLPRLRSRLANLFLFLIEGLAVGTAVMINKKWLFESLEIVKGRELFIDLTKLAVQENWRVFLLGGEGKVSERTAAKLSSLYSGINIRYAAGPKLDEVARPLSKKEVLVEKKVVGEINRFKPDLVFVAFGAPKQELWVTKWLPRLDVGGVMVVGGAFDSFSGKRKLPPRVIEKLGLEWFWRLMREPERCRRIFVATTVFPAKVFLSKLKGA